MTRTTPFDIHTNIRLSRTLVSEIYGSSKSFIPRNADDLVVLGEEQYDGTPGSFRGRCVFHLDSKMANFHVDLISGDVPVETLFSTDKLFADLLDLVGKHDFHRTTFVQRGFKNGRVTLTRRVRYI